MPSYKALPQVLHQLPPMTHNRKLRMTKSRHRKLVALLWKGCHYLSSRTIRISRHGWVCSLNATWLQMRLSHHTWKENPDLTINSSNVCLSFLSVCPHIPPRYFYGSHNHHAKILAMFVCLSVCLFVCLSVCLSVCLFVPYLLLGPLADFHQT